MQRRLLSGTYECSLDNRFRLAIPARLREPFVAGATVGWWIDECLVVVPSVEWPSLIDRTFGTMSVLDDDAREMSRFLGAGAFHHELDRQGRIPLAPELREHAGWRTARSSWWGWGSTWRSGIPAVCPTASRSCVERGYPPVPSALPVEVT